jgi:Ran GTPase-activating protein (RanGAP) involved in mRNA processing and transport
MKFLAKHEDQRPFLKLYHDKNINLLNIDRILSQAHDKKELQDVVQSLQLAKTITHFTHHSNQQDMNLALNAGQRIQHLQTAQQNAQQEINKAQQQYNAHNQQIIQQQQALITSAHQQMVPLQQQLSLLQQVQQIIKQGLAENQNIVHLDLSNTFMGDALAEDLAKMFLVNDKISYLNLAGNALTEKGGLAITVNLNLNNSLTHLDLSNNQLTPKVIENLSSSLASNTTLTYLNLSHNSQGSQILASEAICKILENSKLINTLDLSNMNLGRQGLSKLLTIIAQYKALKSLNIATNGLDASLMEQFGEFLSSEECSLKHLNISGNVLTIDGLTLLSDSLKENNSLESLNISKVGNLGKEGGKCLSLFIITNKTLVKLDISANGLGFLGMYEVAEALQTNKTLSQLNIEGNKLDEAGCIFTAKALEVNHSLTTLDLTNNQIQSTGVIYLAAMLENHNHIKYLNLTNNQIDNSGIEALSSVMSNLRVLNLSNNQIDSNGASFLAETLKAGTALNVLILNNNNLTVAGVLEIISALKSNFGLHTLGLKSVNIGYEQVEQIISVLLDNISIAKLDLGSNNFTKNDAEHIATVLKGNSYIASLNLDGNQLTPEGEAIIAKALGFNNAITLGSVSDKSNNIRNVLSSNINKLQTKLKALGAEDAKDLTAEDLYKLYHQLIVQKETIAPELSYADIKDDTSYLLKVAGLFQAIKVQKQSVASQSEANLMELAGDDIFFNALEQIDIIGSLEFSFNLV